MHNQKQLQEKVTRKIPDPANRAEQLGEQELKEEFSKERRSDSLFKLGKWWSIKQQKPYLSWGSKRKQKQQLLAQRNQRIKGKWGLVGLLLLITMEMGGSVNYRTWGQLAQNREKMGVIQAIKTVQEQSKVAVTLVKEQNLVQAQRLKLDNQIPNSRDRIHALRVMTESRGNLNQTETVAELLKQAIDSANQIPNSRDQGQTLTAIVTAISKLKQPETVAELLKQVIVSANQIPNSRDQGQTLTAIVTAIRKLKQPEIAAELLKEVIVSANQIPNSRDQAYTLTTIAEVMSKLNQTETAVELMKQAIASSNQIPDSRDQAYILRIIAEGLSKLKQPET
ncbi:MAG: hypothetical protein QNJ41_29825 [Xenococcaceae cyanobacterium MO_188.B32]|nr:hypothetical protein [Xenococcaceae cyanobacterium MO_188.B32]